MPRGGKRNPPGGRPAGSTKTTEQKHDIRKTYRWSHEEYQAIIEAREAEGMSEAVFVRLAVLDRVKEVKGRNS